MQRSYSSNPMPTAKSIRVRPLEVSDFAFIRRLSSKKTNFTVPPAYVLWLLKQTSSQSCMVAEHVKLGPLAYLLSVPFNKARRNVLYIWQLTASRKGQRTGAMNVLLLGLRSYVHRMKIRSLVFTAIPDSAEFRAIRRYAYALSAKEPTPSQELPSMVSRNECEFTIMVK
jgi:hypothetical protein